MKTLVLLVLLLAVCRSFSGTPTTIVATTTVPGVITLAAGDFAELLSCTKQGTSPTLRIKIGATEFSAETHENGNLSPVKVAGPAEIKLEPNPNYPNFATFSVTRAGELPSVTPSNAVVIPNDAAGNFQVILESSTDMVTWTAATPGTYSGTTQKRFFRTRIMKL